MSDLGTSAPDAGWYVDPYGDAVERYHDGSQWTTRFRVPGTPGAVTDEIVNPRSTAIRVLVTTLAAVAALGAWFGFFTLPGLPGGNLIRVGLLLVWVTLIVIATPHVSVRQTRAVWVFIPPAGVILTVWIVWRLTLLPYRDWPIRQAELADWQRVVNPADPTAQLYKKRSS